MNVEYQLYVVFYGLCCVRNRGLLKIINGMFCDNNELFKICVRDFRDSDNNFILYFLMVLDFIDEFVVNFVKKFLKGNMFVNVKNNEKVIFLMLVVGQILLRIEVMKNLINVFEKLMLYSQDNIVLIVFYYCLGFNNDDNMCVEYLKIILKGKDVKNYFCRNDINGDIVLSIVVKCLKYSRILSIFKFFESDLNIIYILNKEGYLFLYFVVKLLKDIKVIFEFECCVRVIIFILYGDNLDKILDVEKKVV